jgi:hypothetical protein
MARDERKPVPVVRCCGNEKEVPMSVASPEYFTKEHIETHKFDAPASLAEQAIHCLECVTELAWAQLQFQFKGGNSILIILQNPKRFSIDVDIATNESPEAIEMVLDRIVKECGVFTKWTKRQHKTKPWIPLASYYLFYQSHYSTPENAFIMLDCQLTKSPYATQTVPVQCGGLYKTIVKTDVPLAASLIGDKLLTLGPATLGIPLGKGKEAQRIKHVFDVSLLLATLPSLDAIREGFTACVEHENALQKKSIDARDILADTLLFCKSVLSAKTLPATTNGQNPLLDETIKGLPEFAGHLFSRKYSWNDLRCDIGRVALCITAVCNLDVSDGYFVKTFKAAADDPDKYWNSAMEWLKKSE